MRTLKLICISVCTSLVLASCSTVVGIPEGTPTLTLAKPEERSAALGLKILLPAGDYLPDFANADGVFYVAPTSVIFSNLGIRNPLRGGVFVPYPTAKNQRQKAWTQLSDAGSISGLLGSGSSSLQTYPLDRPVSFEKKPIQSSQPTPGS